MKLRQWEAIPRAIRLAVPYRIAGRTFDSAGMIFVTLLDEDGVTGHGSCTPVPPLTGDDPATALGALRERLLPALAAGDISDPVSAIARAEEASPSERSALAALDIALHDLHAKRLGLPLVQMLGGSRRRLMTSVTVGIDRPEAMVRQAVAHVARGFRILKVKIGEDTAVDLDRLRRIRSAVGPSIAIRVDANEGYSLDDAARCCRELADLDIELFEQPVAAGSPASLALLSSTCPIPVVADESVKVASDLPPLVAARAAGGANIKLMKCGGLAEARRLDSLLHQAGWSALVGCMDESRASIAAAAHFAAAADSVRWIDLDGHLDLSEDPFTDGVELKDGELLLSDAPGLGVVRMAWPG